MDSLDAILNFIDVTIDDRLFKWSCRSRIVKFSIFSLLVAGISSPPPLLLWAVVASSCYLLRSLCFVLRSIEVVRCDIVYDYVPVELVLLFHSELSAANLLSGTLPVGDSIRPSLYGSVVVYNEKNVNTRSETVVCHKDLYRIHILAVCLTGWIECWWFHWLWKEAWHIARECQALISGDFNWCQGSLMIHTAETVFKNYLKYVWYPSRVLHAWNTSTFANCESFRCIIHLWSYILAVSILFSSVQLWLCLGNGLRSSRSACLYSWPTIPVDMFIVVADASSRHVYSRGRLSHVPCLQSWPTLSVHIFIVVADCIESPGFFDLVVFHTVFVCWVAVPE